MFSGPVVTLEQVLANRERRANRQREWLDAHSMPLISFTINMMGEVKHNRVSKIAFEQGYQAIIDVCKIQGIPVVAIEKFISDTGPELLVSAGVNYAEHIKRAMVSIEDEHRLGRLFDIDVLAEDGIAVSRDNLDLPRRKCLVCDNEAKLCARSRAHDLSELKRENE